MWGPATPRRLLWALAGAGRLRPGKPRAAPRACAAGSLRRWLGSFLQPLPYLDYEETMPWEPRSRLDPRRYITNLKLAHTVAPILMRGSKKNRPPIMECNPGPGILTELLLGYGSSVIVLESEKVFIPHLESLGNNKVKLDVVHCDFFKLDPKVCEIMKPPVLTSQTLFENLGLTPVSWSEDVPLKIFGILPIRYERKALWKLMYCLYACNSIYRYGRVELDLIVSEREYQKIKGSPRSPDNYQVLSVVCQVACDIKLLHKEPCSSFSIYNQNGKVEKPKNKEILELIDQDMYLIRLIPRKNLFTENLTPINFDIFFHMIRHCFGKPNASILHHLRALSPIDAKIILKKMKLAESTKVNKMSPRDFKLLFETVESMEGDSVYKWLYDNSMDDSLI
ncbi:dimethyladenosine transferase 2, mitochondrial [Perognathus longimembris pacificus]|uniref:dimethyladenosine transferase 2, mitochondrial n=1 Tax=Perognathus longimembris pacificus TaxID=214514 RepID=UPI0020192D8E|nr:dimethyladenosine transferase 2, mitochondrial [Perognathus longimembris pacificus]